MQVGSFAKAAATQLLAKEWRGIALSLFLLLTVTDAILLTHPPVPGAKPDAAFAAAGALRALGAVSIAVALLRVAVASPRKKWAFDGAFWLYLAISLAQAAIAYGLTRLAGGEDSFARLLIIQASLLLFAPFSAWLVAAAMEQPLALAPMPWFRKIGVWLPPLLILLLPMMLVLAAHGLLTLHLKEIVGQPAFWPLVVADGIVSTVLALALLALRLTAYRAVAKG